MSMDTGQKKATKLGHTAGAPPEPERLPCPRCDSANTKFCYYNNYNFSQPRHFCKSCRRYWTHGGTLRDIPVGGGSRRNAKRCRTGHAAVASAAASGGGGGGFTAAHHEGFRHIPSSASQFLTPFVADHGGGGLPQFVGDAKMSAGSFTSLLNSGPGNGLLALGGFGLGVGNGLGDMGFGLGRAVWPFSGMLEGGASGGGGHTWQMESGESGFVGDGEYFGWPDLAISTPGSVLK